jgi:plasmid stabilization system protein ParE
MQHKTIDSQSGAETIGPSSGGGVETADLIDDTVAPVSAAAESDEQPEAPSPPDEDHAEPVEAGRVPTFLHEIARTMQAAADREREQIAAEMAESLSAHVEKVRSRAATESEELKRRAEEDVDHIREWSAAEGERLRQETENRIGARREDLDRDLGQHDTLVEREISQAGEAVEEYRGELDRFVGRLASEREPTEIARLASLLPEPPSVEEIASAAHADAIAELARSEAATGVTSAGNDLLGVMDPSVIRQTRPNAQEDASPLSANASSEGDQVGQELRPGILGARSRSDLVVRLVVVLALAVLVAVLVLVVFTGLPQAASNNSLSRSI